MVIPDELKGKVTIDVATAARVLGISRNLAYHAARDGTIKTLKLGSRVLVPVGPLLDLLAGQTDEAA
ncbi:helix-turn-helix domain-containing protein [Agromyces humatus]|uniref:Helix-turn-helix domain-containing protein n=1 Tax=Agromyces humatus TaxID=279573 RepID=A0ABN2KX29_9MICO|nr:helix-turn-helix domain-containing protein [Agromyces humatus]